MNSLFTSSWVKNVKPNSEALWNQEFMEIVSEGKRGKDSDPRYGRLMGMKSVKDLKGTMTPRYFVTKILRYLEKENPDKKIEDISDNEIVDAMHIVAQMSRKLQMKPEVKFGSEKASAEAPKLKKGGTGFETLHLNLDPETEFNYEKDIGGNAIYTATHNGLQYNVTLKHADGKPVKLNNISKENVKSVVVVQPKEMETITGGGDVSVQRKKKVADYPQEGEKELDFSIDPEETGGKNTKRKNEEDEENTNINSQEVEKLLGKIDSRMIDSGLYGTPDSAAVFAALRNGDVATAAEEICYSYTDQNGGEANMEDHIKDVEIALNHMLHKGTSQGVEDEEDAEEDDSEEHHHKKSPCCNAPMTPMGTCSHCGVQCSMESGKEPGFESPVSDEDCEVETKPMMIVVKQSPQSVNKHLQQALRAKMQHAHNVERRNMLGY